jgi:hypothetical protein
MGRPCFWVVTGGSWALASSTSIARRSGRTSLVMPGEVKTRRAARWQEGQLAPLLASAMGRDTSNRPQERQLKTYMGMATLSWSSPLIHGPPSAASPYLAGR